MNLSDVSTAALLGEIARRCQHTPQPAAQPLMLPSWAQPALRLVARETGITVSELMDNSVHTQYAAQQRHLAMWLLRLTSEHSLSEIAALWGQNHGTVIYACRKINNLRYADHVFNAFVNALPSKLADLTP